MAQVFANPWQMMLETQPTGTSTLRNLDGDFLICLTYVCSHFRITGAPFFDHYYTAWYFGQRGVGSTLGLGIKNLEASAATSTPVIGPA